MANERKFEIQNYRLELDEKQNFSNYKKNRINQKIKSITMARASNSNIEVRCKTKEGDEFILTPGRVINFSEAIQGITFAWESYIGEWADIDISSNENLVSFTPAQNAVMVTNVSKNVVSRVIEIFYPMFPESVWQTKLAEHNPNRIKIEVENLSIHKMLLGSFEDTDAIKTNELKRKICRGIMPHSRLEFESNEELWTTPDTDFYSLYIDGANPSGLFIKVTEFLR